MENHRRQKAHSTGDMFTFPPISQDMEFDSELADQLFSNGKLLLHAFPVQPASFTIPRSTILSRTSSISSKGSSLMSSRSNSTNSRSSSSTNSSCSSARTSTSEASSRRKLSSINQARSGANKTTSINTGGRFGKKECQNRHYCNSYGHSQRWQFIAPVPVLNRRNSSKKRKGGNGKQDGGVRKGICRRFFGWIVSTCQECHAIEPTKRLKVSM